MLLHHLQSLIAEHGYFLVSIIVGLESMGLPLPGETTLISAAIFAGTTHQLDIRLVIAAAAAGAIAGDNTGFWLGHRFGHDLLIRHGRLVGIDDRRIKLGQYLFARHGGKVVFFGRFVAVLRALAALLAGVNGMAWDRFLAFNAMGGIVWAAGFGGAAYALGEQFERLHGPVAMLSLVAAAIACIAGVWFVRRHEAALMADAERALPGPVQPFHDSQRKAGAKGTGAKGT
jgi:membrane protein DedA with SNARE-associated domain